MIIGKGDKLTYDGKTENFDILILDLNYLLKKDEKEIYIETRLEIIVK